MTASPFFGDGIRRRLGTWNLPLEDMLRPVLRSPLVLEELVEHDIETAPVPALLGLRARRAGPT